MAALGTQGPGRAMSVHPTQREAIGARRDIARNQGSEYLIHGRNGQIRDHDSHGNHPYPPEKLRAWQ